jgi:hypothetical protein
LTRNIIKVDDEDDDGFGYDVFSNGSTNALSGRGDKSA